MVQFRPIPVVARKKRGSPVLDWRFTCHPAPFDIGYKPRVGLQATNAPLVESPDRVEQPAIVSEVSPDVALSRTMLLQIDAENSIFLQS